MPIWVTPQLLKWVGIGLLVASNVLFYQLWKHEESAFEIYRSEVKAAGEAQEQKVTQIQNTQNLVSKGTVDAYKANSAAVANYYRGMRDNSGSCDLPTIPNAPTRADGSTDYRILVQQCAQATLQLKSLQDWVTTQQSVMK